MTVDIIIVIYIEIIDSSDGFFEVTQRYDTFRKFSGDANFWFYTFWINIADSILVLSISMSDNTIAGEIIYRYNLSLFDVMVLWIKNW